MAVLAAERRQGHLDKIIILMVFSWKRHKAAMVVSA
jgi:hypothetical protein